MLKTRHALSLLGVRVMRITLGCWFKGNLPSVFSLRRGSPLICTKAVLPVLGEFQVSVGGFGDFQGIEPVRAFGPGVAGARQVEEPAVGSVGPFDGGLQQSAGVWVEFRLVAVQVGGMGVLDFRRPLLCGAGRWRPRGAGWWRYTAGP